MIEADRELFRLAAKAAGYDGCEFEPTGECAVYVRWGNSIWDWNPRERDEHAFMLAIYCGIFSHAQHCVAFAAASKADNEREAMRLVIFNAAVEIGRKM